MIPRAAAIIRACKRNEVSRRVYLERSRDPTDRLAVAGIARSGTSWLASTLAAAAGARAAFEPFDSGTVAESRIFGEFQHRRPDAEEPSLAAFRPKAVASSSSAQWIESAMSLPCRWTRPSARPLAP